jgi:hypothetical protein
LSIQLQVRIVVKLAVVTHTQYLRHKYTYLMCRTSSVRQYSAHKFHYQLVDLFLYLLHKAHTRFGRISERSVQRVHSRCALTVPKHRIFPTQFKQKNAYYHYRCSDTFNTHNFLKPVFFFYFQRCMYLREPSILCIFTQQLHF